MMEWNGGVEHWTGLRKCHAHIISIIAMLKVYSQVEPGPRIKCMCGDPIWTLNETLDPCQSVIAISCEESSLEQVGKTQIINKFHALSRFWTAGDLEVAITS